MDKSCASCRKPQVDSECGICQAGLCRKCRLFLSDGEFTFAAERPAELKHSFYCGPCHDQHVEPFQTQYQAALEQAKDVSVIYKNSKSTFKVLRKAERPVAITGVDDRNRAILNLAFQAASSGFNSLLDVELVSQKHRNAGWQNSSWSGHGTPADIKSYETDL